MMLICKLPFKRLIELDLSCSFEGTKMSTTKLCMK